MRALPWLQEAHRRDKHAVAHLFDCTKCQTMNPAPIRQYMACGYEPPVDGAVPWCHAGFDRGEDDARAPTVCPGYACKLPEVIETSRLRAHWKVGALGLACEDRPTAQQMDAILLLDGEANGVEVWTMTPVSKGGGRAD